MGIESAPNLSNSAAPAEIFALDYAGQSALQRAMVDAFYEHDDTRDGRNDAMRQWEGSGMAAAFDKWRGEHDILEEDGEPEHVTLEDVIKQFEEMGYTRANHRAQ